MKSFFKEFGKFLNRGNALELAIGVVIGASFTAIVNAIVDGLFKPLLELIPGQDGLSVLKVVLRKGTETSDPVILDISGVLSAIISFIITAFVLFLIVKLVNKIKDSAETAKVTVEKQKAIIKEKVKKDKKVQPEEKKD